MKPLLPTLLLTLLVTFCQAQQTLTQINGWNAYVHLPASYNDGSNRSYPCIININGTGEVGSNPAGALAYGPGARIASGWNGNFTLGPGTIEFIVISLQPTILWPVETAIDTRIETIKATYRTNKIFGTGMSMGGWCWMTYAMIYPNKLAGICSNQGVIANDNQPWPDLFDAFAIAGGSMLNIEQTNDGRGGQQVVDRMNQARPGSAVFVLTTYGNSGHCCWQSGYTLVLPVITMTMTEWIARKTLTIVPITVDPPDTIRVRPPLFSYTNQEIKFKPTDRGQYVIIDKKTGQLVQAGSYNVGMNYIRVYGLHKGFYVLVTGRFGNYEFANY